MQTFLPYASFAPSASVLDRLRLGKQRIEALQILRTLLGLSTGWQRHPAVKMWRGHEGCLLVYGLAICDEWRARGYQDTCAEKLMQLPIAGCCFQHPAWLGDPAFHAAHRAALLAKNPEWYGQFGWVEAPKVEYVWPVPSGG